MARPGDRRLGGSRRNHRHIVLLIVLVAVPASTGSPIIRRHEDSFDVANTRPTVVAAPEGMSQRGHVVCPRSQSRVVVFTLVLSALVAQFCRWRPQRGAAAPQ